MKSVKRNDPCPCGSGKKYKKCCLLKETPATATVRPSKELPDGHFIMELNPGVEEAVDALMQRIEAGESGNIKAELEILLRKYPRHYLTHFGMGVYLVMVDDDPIAALSFFEQSVQIFPRFGEGHYNLAGCAMKTGDIRKAVIAYRAAIRYSADDPDVVQRAQDQLHFITSLLKKEESFTSLDDYIDDQAEFEKAFEAMKQRDFKRAEAGFLKVLARNPRSVQSHGNLGLVYAGLGMKAKALASLDQAIAIDSTYEPARSNRYIVETMTEGQPLEAAVAETHYYLEKESKAKQPKSSIWKKLSGYLPLA